MGSVSPHVVRVLKFAVKPPVTDSRPKIANTNKMTCIINQQTHVPCTPSWYLPNRVTMYQRGWPVIHSYQVGRTYKSHAWGATMVCFCCGTTLTRFVHHRYAVCGLHILPSKNHKAGGRNSVVTLAYLVCYGPLLLYTHPLCCTLGVEV